MTLGPARGKATVVPATLGRGRKLRLRLQVSDGLRSVDTRRVVGLR